MLRSARGVMLQQFRTGAVAGKSTQVDQAARLNHELTTLLGEALTPNLREQLPALGTNPDFQRGLALYRRIIAAARPDRDELLFDGLGAVQADFRRFALAHILSRTGLSAPAVAREVGDTRAPSWITRGQVPSSLIAADPERNARQTIQLTFPHLESPAFAHLLGAHAGTRRLGTEAASLRFLNHEREVVERVVDAAWQSCSCLLRIREVTRRGHTYFEASSQAGQLLEHLAKITSGNSHLPWPHLQTSAERTGFLRGFFDFCGGSVNPTTQRLAVGRRDNPGLLEEVAVLLKREGILGRVSRGAIPALQIENRHALGALVEREIITTHRLGTPLRVITAKPAGHETGRPEEYAAVMAAAARIPGRPHPFPADVLRTLKRDRSPFADLPVSMVDHWIKGHGTPASVDRLADLAALEKRIFTPSRRGEIGQAMLKRLGATLHPTRVVRAVSEFLGSTPALGSHLGVTEREAAALVAGSALPTQSQYRLLLDAVGLPLTPKLAAQSAPPRPETVIAWLKTRREVECFGSYEASIMLTVRTAWAALRDPQQAARERIAALLKRNQRMIRDDF